MLRNTSIFLKQGVSDQVFSFLSQESLGMLAARSMWDLGRKEQALGGGFSRSTSIFPRQHHSPTPPYLFVYPGGAGVGVCVDLML